MTLRKSLLALSIAIIAGSFTAACDEGQQQGSSSLPESSKTSQVDTNSKADKKEWVWPGQPEDPSNLVSEDNPLKDNYMIVYDGSGSMSEIACGANDSKHTEGVKAVNAFANAVPADANLGLFVFDENGIDVRVALGEPRTKFEKAVAAIRIGSGTPLKSATRGGYDELTRQGQKQFGYGRYSLIIITDGAANSGQDPTHIINQIVDNTPIEIWAVGFCLDEGHALNQPGRTFYVPANSPEALLEGLKGVLAEASEDDVTNFAQ